MSNDLLITHHSLLITFFMLTRDSFRHRPIYGMVHLAALPGAPLFGGSIDAVIDAAARDLRAIVDVGCDGVLFENFGDVPFYATRVDAITIAAMTRVIAAVGGGATLFGVNVLRNDARAALAIAAATGAAFIRVNVHAGAVVADQGIIEGEAAETMRRRAALCPNVFVFADHMVKHAVPLAAVDELQSARDLRLRALADAIVVSGIETGAPADPARLRRLREAMPDVPLVVGSGLTVENAARFADADAAIAGTSVKRA